MDCQPGSGRAAVSRRTADKARVPDSSSAYIEAQVARIRCLGSRERTAGATLTRLLSAGSILEGLSIEGEQRVRLTAELLETALSVAQNGALGDQGRQLLLGNRLTERDLRLGLERAYRELARRATTSSKRIGLVDHANRIRPRTWT